MELYLGHVNKQICTLSESASESDSVRWSTSAYYRNRNRNQSRAVETHHKPGSTAFLSPLPVPFPLMCCSGAFNFSLPLKLMNEFLVLEGVGDSYWNLCIYRSRRGTDSGERTPKTWQGWGGMSREGPCNQGVMVCLHCPIPIPTPIRILCRKTTLGPILMESWNKNWAKFHLIGTDIGTNWLQYPSTSELESV